MTLNNSSVLLSAPVVDLVELPLSDFYPLLRGDALPDDETLAALDRILMLKSRQILTQGSNLEALRSDVDDLRRLVPHRKRAELDQRAKPWAARWATLGDLLDIAAEMIALRRPDDARNLAHADEILELVEHEPGLSQGEVAARLELSPANLSRIVGVLEANGLLRREAVGRQKLVYPGRAPAAAHADVVRGMTYLVAA